MKRHTTRLALAACLATAAWADEPAPAAPIQPAAPATADAQAAAQLEVAGARDPDWKPYRRMLSGLDAFDKHHNLAPTAPLRFELRPQQAGLTVDGAKLSIEGKETQIDVPVAADGSFALPRSQAAADEDADLVLNRKKSQFRWRPSIHSAVVPAGMRRLGDLRLECEVRWAVEYDEMPFFTRNLFRMAGGPCHNSHIAVMFPAPFKLGAIALRNQDKREVLPASALRLEGQSYTPPLHDAQWPDDTLVEFIPDGGKPAQAEAKFSPI